MISYPFVDLMQLLHRAVPSNHITAVNTSFSVFHMPTHASRYSIWQFFSTFRGEMLVITRLGYHQIMIRIIIRLGVNARTNFEQDRHFVRFVDDMMTIRITCLETCAITCV